jgi:hypothetical protein
MDAKLPHIHLSALDGITTLLYVIVGFGAIHIIARKYEGHPLADAALNFIC